MHHELLIYFKGSRERKNQRGLYKKPISIKSDFLHTCARVCLPTMCVCFELKAVWSAANPSSKSDHRPSVSLSGRIRWFVQIKIHLNPISFRRKGRNECRSNLSIVEEKFAQVKLGPFQGKNYYGFLKKVQTHRKRKVTCTKKKRTHRRKK